MSTPNEPPDVIWPKLWDFVFADRKLGPIKIPGAVMWPLLNAGFLMATGLLTVAIWTLLFG